MAAAIDLAQGGTPLDVPSSLHLVLWPALIAWVWVLALRRRSGAWAPSVRLGLALAPIAFLADAVAVAASLVWPAPASNSFVFALLWLAILLSLTTYVALRVRDDGDDGGEDADGPEPPWWPEFERQLRDYTRNRPRPSAGSPRTPLGTSA